ncbi:MAG TPA: DinB family protein [Terracidiphilus sp.]|nr:DinB family protein [Terracidiphilus sp.]
MKVKFCAVFAGLMMFSVTLLAQQAPQAPTAPQAPPANPITASERGLYANFSNNVVRAAEKMPEENYSFKPTPEVRSFGQLVGHEADANFNFCALAIGEANPSKGSVEKTKTTKADLVAAVKDAVAYCNKAFEGMTDAKGSEMVKLFGRINIARLGVFSLNTAHTDEHYGNMVTYMRLKGIVPPSSEQQPAQPPPAAPK